MKHRILAGAMSAALLVSAMSTAAFAKDLAPVIAPNPLISPNPVIAPNSEGLVTRAQVVSRLWELSGRPTVNYLLQFEDVTEGSETAEAIRWAASEKIASGYGNGSFGAGDPVTREQLATIIYNYVKKFDMGFVGSWMFLMPYTDRSEVSEWAFEPVMWMVASRLFSTEMEQLEPDKTVTAEEAGEIFRGLAAVAAEKNVDFARYGEVKK